MCHLSVPCRLLFLHHDDRQVQHGIVEDDRVGVGWTSGVKGGKKSEVGITYKIVKKM